MEAHLWTLELEVRNPGFHRLTYRPRPFVTESAAGLELLESQRARGGDLYGPNQGVSSQFSKGGSQVGDKSPRSNSKAKKQKAEKKSRSSEKLAPQLDLKPKVV